MEKLNCRAAEVYPSRAQESAGLKVDQFIRTPKSQSKWYRQHRLRQDSNSRPGRTIFSWSDSEARLNAQYSRVAKASAYPQSCPASRPVPQDILRRWEKCAREGTYITNHTAAFNRCTSEIQEKMNSHISLLSDVIVKGKAPKEVVNAIKDLKDLSAFHSNVSVSLGTSLQHLADSLFIQLANFILLRRDSYLEFARAGLKPDTWNRLRNAPLFSSSLFPDDILATAEQDIAKFESASAQGPGPGTGQHSGRNTSRTGTNRTKRRITDSQAILLPSLASHGVNFLIKGGVAAADVEVATPVISPDRPVDNTLNDNYCWTVPHSELTVEDPIVQDINQNVSLHVVCRVPCVTGLSENKDISPFQAQMKIKCVKPVCCVNHCLYAPTVQNVPHVVEDPPVGARLQRFWQIWHSLGANTRVVSILQEGYNLPFKDKPPLTRSPVIISGYANPVKNKHIKDSLQALLQKQAVEKVTTPSSLTFYNRLFLVPKPNNKWRPILDLSRLNCYLATSSFKMETPETIRISLQKGEWVTSLDAYLHIPIGQRSRKFLRFFLHSQAYQFTALPFGLSTAPLEFTKVAKEVKLMAQARGIRIHQYLNDWLLRAPCPETCLLHTRTLLDLCHRLGWVVNLTKSELVPQQVFNFVGYRFDLSQGLVKPTQERWMVLSQKINDLLNQQVCSVRQFMSLIGLLTATEKQVVAGRLHVRPIQWHLKRHWHVPESLEKIITFPQSLHPHLRWWLDPSNVLKGQPLHPLQHALQLFTDASNEGWGAHLGDFTARGLWSTQESALHINLLELKAVLLALKRFERLCWKETILVCSDNTTVVSYINKEGGMKSGSLCALLWRLLMWCNQRQIVLRARHIPGHLNVIADKLSRHGQVIQTEWSLLQEVFDQICRRWHKPEVDLFATKFKHKLPRFVSPVPDLLAWKVDALSVPWRNLDAYAFPPVALLGKVVSKLMDQGFHRVILIAPGWPNMPWFWDLVSMSVQIPLSLPKVGTFQSVSSQRPSQSESACMDPRAFAIQQAGFSGEVATRIEAPQRRSTRAIYESKWAVFVRWCEEHKVDVGSPSIKQIADFLLFLFQEKHLQPSTIDGYRTAISDKIGNGQGNIGKDENLTRLLDSFHRDKPKGRRGVPSWNLSLVLHQLTKLPFEPLRKASLKHLTFKMVFLLALGSGKRRTEIHAWVHKNIRHQEDWSNVSLYPSPSFISKNHLAKEGPGCIDPVIIPALAPTLDKSLKEDRTLCPVRSLHYYLDKTKDLRADKELVFVSFRKSFKKDIVPATVSSWIKQTIGLCYQLSDEQAQNLHQVRAHDVRAFAASKAFQGGVPLDQSLCSLFYLSR